MFATVEEIKAAVDAGKPVRWMNDGYRVHKDSRGEYLITFTMNGHTVGLTDKAGRLTESPEGFYIKEGDA